MILAPTIACRHKRYLGEMEKYQKMKQEGRTANENLLIIPDEELP